MKAIHWTLFLIELVSSDYNPLNGKHLSVGPLVALVHATVIRNTTGQITRVDGVAAKTLAVLSQRFNFTYSYLQVNDNSIEKQNDSLPGLAYYMEKGKCDLMMGTIVMVSNRLISMDFAEGYSYTTVAVVIPMPQSTSNTAAIIKPFQISVIKFLAKYLPKMVWIGLLLLIPVTAIAIYLSIHPIPGTIRSDVSGWKQSAMQRPASSTAGQIIFEVCRILLNQGGRVLPMPRLAVYFVLGSWYLGTFVLISAYNSVLVSYILGSNAEPLVDSVTDLAGKPNVRLVVDEGKGIDIVLSSAKDGIYKQLGDKLRSDPKSRCATHRDCINLVKSGKYTYIQGMFGALTMISQDFKATNKCNLAIAKRSDPTPGSLAWILPKKSPNTKVFVKGFMQLHQAGLIDFWTRREQEKHQNANFCLNEAKEKQRGKLFDNRTKITLKNFSGAFYILIFGCIMSFLCFVGENLSPMLINFGMNSRKSTRKILRT